MSSKELDTVIEKFNEFTQKPAKFLTVQENVRDDIKNLVKSLYDFTKSNEDKAKNSKSNALQELIVQDFDEEQIWQEIELQNNDCWDDLVWEVANCINLKNDLLFPVEEVQEPEKVADKVADDHPTDEEEIEESGSENEQIDDKHESEQKAKQKPKVKSSLVDDQFFKLQDMEKFLLKEEKHGGKLVAAESDEESIDLFDDIDDEDSEEEDKGGKNVMYSDFFSNENGDDQENEKKLKKKKHQPKDLDDDGGSEFNDEDEEINEEDKPKDTAVRKRGKMVTFADGSSDDEDSSEGSDKEAENKTETKVQQTNEKLSEFELRQQRLKQQISRLEEKTVSEAPWQLKGEVDATKRPQNSLLQEVVDFDLTTRPAPIITEQTTVTLEDIIKRRIKDKAWDDVLRKEKPNDNVLAFKKTEILDQNKSKLSLAQVYEAEYLKQKQSLNGEIEEEKEPESHTQVREAMDKLFAKLDALSHYHYTPKAAQPEVKIISNTPAIAMEEVAPVAVSDAALLAPEEVRKKRTGDLMSKEERTDTDKKRERRKKKMFQQKKGKVAKVTEQRNTKKGVEVNNDKSLKTSKAFFQQLNDDTTSLLKKSDKRKSVKNKGQ